MIVDNDNAFRYLFFLFSSRQYFKHYDVRSVGDLCSARTVQNVLYIYASAPVWVKSTRRCFFSVHCSSAFRREIIPSDHLHTPGGRITIVKNDQLARVSKTESKWKNFVSGIKKKSETKLVLLTRTPDMLISSSRIRYFVMYGHVILSVETKRIGLSGQMYRTTCFPERSRRVVRVFTFYRLSSNWGTKLLLLLER